MMNLLSTCRRRPPIILFQCMPINPTPKPTIIYNQPNTNSHYIFYNYCNHNIAWQDIITRNMSKDGTINCSYANTNICCIYNFEWFYLYQQVVHKYISCGFIIILFIVCSGCMVLLVMRL